MQRFLLLLAVSSSAIPAFAADAEVRNIYVAPEGNEIRVEAELSGPLKPIISTVADPCRLIIEFPHASFAQHSEYLSIDRNGVGNVQVAESPEDPADTRIVVELDLPHPYVLESVGNRFVLSILPASAKSVVAGASPAVPSSQPAPVSAPAHQPSASAVAASATASALPAARALPAPRTFKVKYLAGNTVYLNGGANAGLRTGMQLQIHPKADVESGQSAAILRVMAVAASSAIADVRSSDSPVAIGDLAELTAQDARLAAQNVQSAAQKTVAIHRADAADSGGPSSISPGVRSNSFRPVRGQTQESGTRMSARIGFDLSSITSGGSTPGTSLQRGISFQSDMTHILGTHWNLQGYWRGRTNDHSQFQQPTIEESLNKTYTMQLYYDNPASKWVAGVGRLYLPWAVSLDTIDGAYVGHKWPLGMTTGIFAGSTPDINSWHYRPNQRTGGTFINFQGGDYQGFHYSSTSGVGVNTLVWKLDRPFAFFENEASYKNTISVYHSLIADSLRGLSTNGLRLGPGISHSYFTAHYTPNRMISLDAYHNYFRDVPTATTTILGTGLVDQLLFQGFSAGVHVRPVRDISLYTMLGASEKTGDSHRSLNQMYGASWSEIARSGFRADVHYSKFDSNFAAGNYKVVSLSRQITNRAFWNAQVGQQSLQSIMTTNRNSIYVDDSFDINIGRKSYMQSGYTYVNGSTMNYRQWYFSWGYRFDGGKRAPEFVETQGPVH